MKSSLIFVLLVCFVFTIAVPVEKIKFRARQNNEEEAEKLELELKDLQKRVSKLKAAVIRLKPEGGGVSEESNDELEKEEEMLERGSKSKETNSNPEKEEQPTGPVVFTTPVKLSETNIEDVVEKVAKTVRMLEKMLQHNKHTVTQHGHTEDEIKDIRAKQTAATTKPNTETKTLLTRGTAEPTRKPPKESTMNGERTTVSTEAVIKTSAINELKDDLEITVEKITRKPAREPEPEAKTTRTPEPEVKTSNAQKKKAAATKGLEPETAKIEPTTEAKNSERTTVSTEAVIKTSAINELKDDLEITVEKITSEPAREPEPEAKTTRTLEPEVKTGNAQKKKAAATKGLEPETARIEPTTEAKNGERTTVSTEAVIRTSPINELKDDLEITVEKITSKPAREPEPEAKTTRTPEPEAKTRTLEPEVKTRNALKAIKGLEPETGGGSQEGKKITIEKITPTKLTDASVTTDNEPEAHIISVERIYPGKSTGSVTSDDKKTAKKLAQQIEDEELELAGKQPHKNKRTQGRTEETAEHALNSKPTRQQVIEPTPTPDKMAINKEEEKLEHELEKEKLPKKLHPPTQVPTGKSTIILKVPMTTAKQPAEKEEKKVTERTLLSSKVSQAKAEHIPDELQEELTNKHSTKIEKVNTRKITQPITEPVKISISPIPRQTTQKTVTPPTKPTQHKIAVTTERKKSTSLRLILRGTQTLKEKQEKEKGVMYDKIKTRKPGLHHLDETTTTTESTRSPAHYVEELEEELERQLKGQTKMARVRKSQVNRDLEEDLKEIALH